ncbi:MAG: Hpt domain-containing protein [Microcoleaceae cyanobacterium]
MALDQITELFLMEGREHLETLEKGLVDLQSTMKDPENIAEMFRAAHSVKGGAAMLGLDSIKDVSHRLEDCFKILRDDPAPPVDQASESLFLKGVDTLKDLLDRLESPFGLREEEASQLVKEVMPVFTELENHLNALLKGGVATATQTATPSGDIVAQVKSLLQEMLQIFRQTESPATRKKLVEVADRVLQLSPSISSWQSLLNTAKKAIGNQKASYQVLAPLIIREVKEAADLISTGKMSAIGPSPSLQQIASGGAPPAPKQISLIAEPQSAAKVLIQNFNKRQLAEIAKLLVEAIKS